MKTTSWEIILAGFLFVGVAIFIIENSSEAPAPKTMASSSSDSISTNIDGKSLKVIQLKSLEGLENLEQLSELEDLEKLESLKSLSSFLPAEVQAEIETEINEVIKDLEEENIRVNFNAEKQTISINKELKSTDGKWTTLSPGVFAFVKKIDASEFTQINIELPFGSINVVGSSGKEAIFSIEASGQVSTKADLESKIRANTNVENGTAVFSVIPINPSKDHNVHLQATLTIPQNSTITSQTNAGHISAKNMNGDQSYHTLGGHIKLNNVTGQIHAKTNGGHVTVKEADGDLDLHSLGGHILIQDSKGIMSMTTSGGNLQAIDVKGSVEASTNGGNIELRFLQINDTTIANTGAGTISIWVPESVNSNFELSGNSVEISDKLGFHGTLSSGSAIGKIGSGTATLQAKTNYGKVILKSID